ncbi:tRNA pseudouridine synthase 1 [Recurvomyces mirabilis]|nr:tRNA pseudouridine synthase 1 [Recurvomyces mirabilis]
MDPLVVLPPEIVLRILEFTPVPSVAQLNGTSSAWHDFIDKLHQEAVYSSGGKVWRPPGTKDFEFLATATSFAKIYEGVHTSKELCKQQTLLARNWNDQQPLTTESVLQVGNDPVWRFRPDFKRRFFVSTSQSGGLNVTDMSSGNILWRLPYTTSSDEHSVRPYAHLEYQDGIMCFDREGDAIEVWQTDIEGLSRGEFRRITILPHDCQTRGFQLSHDTLCVVSTEGQAFVYDMQASPPVLKKHVRMDEGAIGHLDQNEDIMVVSMGNRGYHVYDKGSGELIGTLEPRHVTAAKRYHIRHPARQMGASDVSRHGPTPRIFPPEKPSKNRLVPLSIENGPLPRTVEPQTDWQGDDEWGAGLLYGDMMVGFSRTGQVFICSDWRKALRDHAALHTYSAVIECESDGASFDLGGWLSATDHRIMFEIRDRVYVVGLTDENKIPTLAEPERPSYSLLSSSAPQLAVPVSFMALFDDCIMTTYTTLGWRQNPPGSDGIQQRNGGPSRFFPTKAIRIISLAPVAEDSDTQSPMLQATMADDTEQRTQTGLLQLVSMLGDELDDDEEDALGVMETDFHDAV